jgi:hypothetical protein
MAILVAIAGWSAVAGVAGAAVLVDDDMAPMDGIPAEPPAAGAPLSVIQFNPAQGILQSVLVEFDVTLDGTMGAESKQAGAAQINLELTLDGWLHEGMFVCPDIPLGTGALLGAAASGNELTLLPGNGTVRPFPVMDTQSDSVLLTAPGDLAPFIGAGDVDFTGCFLAKIAVAGIASGNVDLSFTADALVKVTVTYTFISTGITIEKSTNGEDADVPTGPLVPVGDPVDWLYLVTNTGEATINEIDVLDDQGVTVTCPFESLIGGASMECTAAGVAPIGQYANIGSVTGQPVDDGGEDLGPPIGDDDPSHHLAGSPVSTSRSRRTALTLIYRPVR